MGGKFSVALASREEAEDLELALGELGHCHLVSPRSCALRVFLDHAPRYRGGKEGFACGNDSDRVYELFRRRVLQHESARSSAQRFENVVVALERRKHEDAACDLGVLGYLTRRFETIQIGHLDVHEQDTGLKLTAEGDCLAAIGCFPDNLEVLFGLEDHPEACAHERLVVDEEDLGRHRAAPFNGNVACTTKPSSGVPPTRRCPPCSPTRSRIPTSPWPPRVSGGVVGSLPSSRISISSIAS